MRNFKIYSPLLLSSLFGVIMFSCFFASSSWGADTSMTKKPLIAYFSESGHTKAIAGDIQAYVGGELVQIEPVKPYPTEYQELVDLAKKEQNDNARPEIKTRIENLDQYNVIFLGFPNWWSSMPMPVYTFVEENKLNGKTIIPFCTHGGGGLGHTIEDLRKLCPNSNILKPFSISGNRATDASSAVKKWLEGLETEIKLAK